MQTPPLNYHAGGGEGAKCNCDVHRLLYVAGTFGWAERRRGHGQFTCRSRGAPAMTQALGDHAPNDQASWDSNGPIVNKRHACANCKRSKVSCARPFENGPCTRCVRLGLQCDYTKEIKLACLSCRRSKVKCNVTPDSPCSRCTRRISGFECRPPRFEDGGPMSPPNGS